MAISSIHSGWRYAPADSRLNFYYRGTRIGHINATELNAALILTIASGAFIDFDAAADAYAALIRDVNNNEILDVQGVASAVNQVGILNSATGGNVEVSARGGDTNIGITRATKGTGAVLLPAASQGLRGGVSSARSTPGTNVVEFKEGTAPAGAGTTTSGIHATATVLQKINAAGTASAIET